MSATKTARKPALNPIEPELVQPWKDFVMRGFLDIHVKFSPLGSKSFAILNEQLFTELQESNKTVKENMIPFAVAREFLEKKGLGKPKKGKATQEEKKTPPKPTKNLKLEEFGGNPKVLIDRIRSVAKAINGSVAYGRISSCGLQKEGCSDFLSWWEKANPAERARIFISDKELKDASLEKKTHVGTVFSTLNCPFRGSFLQEDSRNEANSSKSTPLAKEDEVRERGKEKRRAISIPRAGSEKPVAESGRESDSAEAGAAEASSSPPRM